MVIAMIPHLKTVAIAKQVRLSVTITVSVPQGGTVPARTHGGFKFKQHVYKQLVFLPTTFGY